MRITKNLGKKNFIQFHSPSHLTVLYHLSEQPSATVPEFLIFFNAKYYVPVRSQFLTQTSNVGRFILDVPIHQTHLVVSGTFLIKTTSSSFLIAS